MGELINIGFHSAVSADRIIAIIPMGSKYPSHAMTRLKKQAQDREMLIDTTGGRRTRAVIVTDSNHVILSAIQAHTLSFRYVSTNIEYEDEDADKEEAEDD